MKTRVNVLVSPDGAVVMGMEVQGLFMIVVIEIIFFSAIRIIMACNYYYTNQSY